MDIVQCLSWEVSPTSAGLWVGGITLKDDLVEVWLKGFVLVEGWWLMVSSGSGWDQACPGIWDPQNLRGSRGWCWLMGLSVLG